MAQGDAKGTSEPTARRLVSVLVSVLERPEALDDIYREYSAPLRSAGYDAEFVFAVAPWHRSLAEPLTGLIASGHPIRVVEAAGARGEATLLKLALASANGDPVITLPAYYRVDASALPKLVQRVEQGADVATARRWPRMDPWLNQMQSRVFHRLLGRLAGGGLDDVASGVRAMRREVLETIPLYGDLLRFLPLLAIHEGFAVRQVDAPQHRRDQTKRVYSPGVYLRRLIDLLGLFFLLRFTYKPLRFFGLIGSAFALAGLAILGVLLAQRLGGQGIADRPLLLLGALLVTLGVQSVALGLVGEIIVHFNVPRRSTYRVEGELSEEGS